MDSGREWDDARTGRGGRWFIVGAIIVTLIVVGAVTLLNSNTQEGRDHPALPSHEASTALG